MARPKVAVRRARPETVLEDYRTLLEAADYSRHLDPHLTTLLKDSLEWDRLLPGANTTPWQLEGVVRTLLEGGYRQLALVQGGAPRVDAYKAEQFNHFIPIFNKYHLEVRYTSEPGDMRWELYQPKARMRVLDRVSPGGIRVPDFVRGKNLVHLPTVKTDVHTTTAGAMHNALDALIEPHRVVDPEDLHALLVDLLAIQREIHPGIFGVMDGTTCGNGPGPRTLQPVIKDILLASSDPVAIDAVAARIMGFDPMSIPYLRMADEDGLGVARLDQIEVVGEDIRELNFHFTTGDGIGRRLEAQRWFGPVRRLRRALRQTPAARVLEAGTRLYDERLWYPVRGRELAGTWLETRWGLLFQRYGSQA
jgi:hypothetical protein